MAYRTILPVTGDDLTAAARLHLAKPSGRDALTVVRFFHGEFTILDVGDYRKVLGVLHQCATQAAFVLGVRAQQQCPGHALTGQSHAPSANKLFWADVFSGAAGG